VFLNNEKHWFLRSFKNWMNLRKAWIIYFFVLFIYIGIAYFIQNSLFISLGVTTMTILILYLIMLTSNKEIRSAIEKEADSFVENLKSVTLELKNVGEETAKSIDVLSKIERHMANMAGKTEELFEYEQQRDREKIERVKPRLILTMKRSPFWVFWTHYNLVVINRGGVAKNIQISYLVNNKWFLKLQPLLQRDQEITIDCGDISIYKSSTSFQIWISTYDEENRHYEAQKSIDVNIEEQIEVSLQLIST